VSLAKVRISERFTMGVVVIKPSVCDKSQRRLSQANCFIPGKSRYQIKIPDVTPSFVTANALTDGQALLAKVRYNRLIDNFLGVTAYSLQNNLRTTVPDIGHIETDELYIAYRNTGQQFVIPVQTKHGKEKIRASQVVNDFTLCRSKFPALTPRPVAAQYMRSETGVVIVLFEFIEVGNEIKVMNEKHYRLVPESELFKARE
jgi:hypothetical protein